MNKIRDYIQSGILELYVLGLTNPDEKKEVETLASAHAEIAREISEISKAIEETALRDGIMPDPTIRPFLMAIIDYSERIKAGEAISFPPELNEWSRMSDYKEWLDRSDMVLPADFDEFHAKIIGHTDKATTAIVWLNSGAPPETHHEQFEKFLVLEGTCDITIDGKVHSLEPGNYLSIPLHVEHFVKVTSDRPCKVILQRIAA